MQPTYNFESYLSFKKVVACLSRIKQLAIARRHEEKWKAELVEGSTTPFVNSPVDTVLPSGSRVHSVRSRYRHGSDRTKVHRDALYAAVFAGLESTPEPTDSYVPELAHLFSRIQDRVFGNLPFRVSPPTVRAERKRPGQNDFRAITRFSFEDRIIGGCVASYLRDLFDPLFLDTAYSFRSNFGPRHGATNATVFSELAAFREVHGAHGLYVAEADIRSFYDCIDHEVVRAAFNRACKKLRKTGVEVDARAVAVFHAFLDAFSFQRDVLGRAQDALRRKHPNGEFSWPIDVLNELHGYGSLENIGLAQGSAISTIIVNLIMDLADRAVMEIAKHGAAELFYGRYCDDVIIISPNRDLCTSGHDAYCGALKQLKLPMHPPKEIITAADAANAKSKQTYLWDSPPRGGVVQWVGFVGFELRFDGQARISRASIRKHLDRMRAKIDAVLKVICKEASGTRNPKEFAALRKTAIQIIHSTYARIVGMSTGSIHARPGGLQGPFQCWLACFSALEMNPALEKQLWALEKLRRKQLQRLVSKLKFLDVMVRDWELRRRAIANPPSYRSRFVTAKRRR